ncbi:MAG: hypothetical protein GY868_12340 [Deltaproteobacteria bacterium]|nr:hypothetical protein [Deltaproteobacteria bacterium]
MKKQLELLYTIQTIDNNISQAEILQKKYGAEIGQLEQESLKEEAILSDARTALEEREKEHRDRERGLKGFEDQIKKTEDRMTAIKTNKEYHAALQEIETIKKAISNKEDGIIEAMDLIEEAKQQVGTAEAEAQKIKARFEGKKQEIETELNTRLADIEKQKNQRDELLKEIKPGLMSDYRRIQKNRQGRGVALAENEQCLGCSMKIPPQVYNEVVLGEKLLFCPHCQRILVVKREQSPCDEN